MTGFGPPRKTRHDRKGDNYQIRLNCLFSVKIGFMKVTVNGEVREIDGEMTLAQLLDMLGVPAQRIAIELNREVVRRKEWTNINVSDADRIEIVHFVGGG